MTSKPGAGIGALARLYIDIAIWRRGPQHVPGVSILLPLTLGAYLAVNALLSVLLSGGAIDVGPGAWTVQLGADCVFLLLWYWGLLRLFGRGARYRQTICAIFGYQTVLAPAILVAGWLVQQDGSNSLLQLPVYLAALVMLAWTVLAMAHILAATLERPLSIALALAVLQILTESLLVYAVNGAGG